MKRFLLNYIHYVVLFILAISTTYIWEHNYSDQIKEIVFYIGVIVVFGLCIYENYIKERR
jgi:hypothetical protein